MNGRNFEPSQFERFLFCLTLFKTKSLFRSLIEFLVFVTQSMMSRRVKQYLSNLTIIQDEEKLRDMSQVCEPPQGSGKY